MRPRLRHLLMLPLSPVVPMVGVVTIARGRDPVQNRANEVRTRSQQLVPRAAQRPCSGETAPGDEQGRIAGVRKQSGIDNTQNRRAVEDDHVALGLQFVNQLKEAR